MAFTQLLRAISERQLSFLSYVDDSMKSTVDQLINTVANLQTQVTTLVAENNVLKANLTKLEAQETTESKSLCILFNTMYIYIYITYNKVYLSIG